MPFMRRIERPAEQPDALAGNCMKRLGRHLLSDVFLDVLR